LTEEPGREACRDGPTGSGALPVGLAGSDGAHGPVVVAVITVRMVQVPIDAVPFTIKDKAGKWLVKVDGVCKSLRSAHD
jgi:hypothetical protein